MFTKKKFLSLPFERQHKKCAELLKRFLSCSNEKERGHLLFYYNEWQQWLENEPLLEATFKLTSDRYHFHLKMAKQNLQEHNLLVTVRQGDRAESEEIWPIALYLDHIRSAHNVGSIIRSVEAFALGTLFFSEQTPFIDNKQVQDSSMGAFQWVHCHQLKDLQQLPKPLIAMETSPQALSIYDFLFPPSFTLVVGNEEYGCSDVILKASDFLIEIPLRGRKNSINVANAFAIAASEIQRQRKEYNENQSL